MPSKTETLARAADRCGLGALLRRLPAQPVVLTYHRIGDPRESLYDRHAWDATEEAFDAQLAFLAKHFDVISPQDLREPAKGRRVVITFDDGYRDNHDLALPLLRSHDLTATFFVTTGFIDEQTPAWWDELAWLVRTSEKTAINVAGATYSLRPPEATIDALLARYKTLPIEQTDAFMEEVAAATGTGRHGMQPGSTWMGWDEVRALRDARMTIGGHSVTHPILARCGVERQREEVQTCAQRLHDELGIPMRWFSYPVGLRDCFDAHTREAVRDAGVQLAFSLYGPAAGDWDPYDVRRCSVGNPQRPRFRMMVTAPRVFARV